MLLECVVGAPLRWGTVEIAPPWVRTEGIAVPLLDRVGRIGKYDIESHQAVAFDKLGLGKRIASFDAEVLDAMEKAIHSSN